MREQHRNNLPPPSHRPKGRNRRERGDRGRDLSKYDAIHRALLAGLLGNVANKTEVHEYTGARGTKMHIFPGSSQFERKPQWIVAAELVETTKLYARTVAKIQPDWVEHLADHLVKRTYTDPHWNPQTAHVVAYEKVTLYGLTIVPQRTVHYGPIDPKVSREIFIRALVEGEYHTDAPFFRHNQKLIDDIQTLEAKSRQRDVLVSHEARFDFYNARIPAGVYNGPLFEKWRRSVERNSPRILFMSRRDLMMHSAADVTQELFPDHLFVGGKLRVPLEYHFEPGHSADGVTATIPLPALNQAPAERFEWVVPGLLREKITALIKSLPKQLRVNFVPAPDYAEKAYQLFVDAARKQGWEALGSINDALATFLSKQQGVTVPASAFDPASLLDHLHTNFKIADEAGKQIAMGRDLNELRRRLGIKVRTTFEQIEHPKFNRDDVTEWDFGDLPESVQVQRHGMTLTAYPALAVSAEPAEDRKSQISNSKSAISLRLFDSREAAAAAHAAGLRRLFVAELHDEIRYFSSNIPGIRQMCLHYATLGPCQDLKDDIVGETINRAFLEPDTNVRTQMEFELRKQAGRRHRLLEVGREVAMLAAQILDAYHQVALQLSKPAIPAFAAAIQDVRQQVAHLMPKGFLTTTPDAWLVHYPRFLKAILLRLQKLTTAGHSRDATYMAELTPFWTAYVERLKHNRAHNVQDPALQHFRWMLEEFRVSLFAQELKTSIPISARRLEKQWEIVRK